MKAVVLVLKRISGELKAVAYESTAEALADAKEVRRTGKFNNARIERGCVISTHHFGVVFQFICAPVSKADAAADKADADTSEK